MTATLMEERLLTETEAAEMLGLKPSTLRRWRSVGEPSQPDYVRINRSIRYKYSTCLAYMEALPTSGGVR